MAYQYQFSLLQLCTILISHTYSIMKLEMKYVFKVIIIITVVKIYYYKILAYNYPYNSRSGFFEFLFTSCKCKCGLPNRQARPSGGEYLNNYEFPWLAFIQKKDGTALGSLITNKHVLTTASILYGLTPFDIKVTLGQSDRCSLDTSSLNVSVETLIVHQEFNPGTKVHDIALIKLSSSVLFEKRISPICLSTLGSSYVGQVATFVGWSVLSGDRNSTNCRMQKVGLPVLGVQDCYKSVYNSEFVTSEKRCAGIIGITNVVCQSDEGSPVMYRTHKGVYELIGIVSEKNECNGKPSLALYSATNNYISWIVENTRDACYCLKIN